MSKMHPVFAGITDAWMKSLDLAHAKGKAKSGCDCGSDTDGYSNFTAEEKLAFHAGYHFAADFAKKQAIKRTEAAIRSIDSALADLNVALRELGDMTPMDAE